MCACKSERKVEEFDVKDKETIYIVSTPFDDSLRLLYSISENSDLAKFKVSSKLYTLSDKRIV